MTRALANLRLLARDDVGVSSLRGALAMCLVGSAMIGYTLLNHPPAGHGETSKHSERGAAIP